MNITPISNIPKDDFTAGTAHQSVKVLSAPVNVDKVFSTSTSDLLYADAPEGKTIIALLNTFATIYPGEMTIIEDESNVYVKFDATIFFTVQFDDGYVDVISSMISVLGELGSTSEIISATVPSDEPKLSYTDQQISPDDPTKVQGRIVIPSFICTTVEFKDVNLVINPDIPLTNL